MVTRTAAGVDVLSSPGPGNLEERPRVERVRHVLRFARSQYGWTVIDLGRLSLLAVGLIGEIKDLLLIAELEVPALFEAKRVVEKLCSLGLERESLHLVLNRTAKSSDLSAGELEQIVGLPVYATVPNNYQALYQAYADGAVLPAAHPVRRRIGALAGRLGGVEKTSSPKTPAFLRFLWGAAK
jgi:Flp pilus assembly CpaE family ATPase